jgi:hypothetical protein
MACDYSTGVGLGCKDVIGGLKALYFFTDGTSPYTLTAADVTFTATTTQEIEDIDTAVTVYKWDLPRNTATFSEALESSDENGSIMYAPTLVITLHGLQYEIQDLLQGVAKNYQSVGVLTNRGNMFIAGFERGLGASAGDTVIGAGLGDGQNMTLTLSSQCATRVKMLPAPTAGATGYPFDGLTTVANVTISATQITPA